MAVRACRGWQHDRRDGQCLNPALADSDFCAEHAGNIKGPSRCGSEGPAFSRYIGAKPTMTEAVMQTRADECQYCHAKDGTEHFQSCPRNPSNTSRIPAEARAIAEAPHAMYDAITDEEYLEPVDWDAIEEDDGAGSSVDDRVGKQLGELDWQVERTLAKGKVTRNDIIAWHRQICEEARDLAVLKNKDYASDSDPLKNFRLSAQAAGISLPQVCLVYLAENVAKYGSFIENGGKNAVRTDKLIDHIKDSINFNILLYAILIDEGYFAHDAKSCGDCEGN